ncbi:hypothetical protein OEZ85_007467 [Tetradesmus obliquus]|uniref:Expansin-like EG45 domain-containing protein n=1 Tax=Tetradesmus obliquus TaxID=3088 RepID=A0ABY8TJI9_TETOB|nr:hypothetical protein OEZ85_007467 [Tetradesmus obliquus]
MTALLVASLWAPAVDSAAVPTVQSLVAAELEPTPLGPWYQGTASFFGGPQATAADTFKVTIDSGSCGYGDLDPKLWPFYNVLGLNPNNELIKTRPQGACGSCLEIECTGPRCNKNVTTLPVVITDSCNWDCNATNINMHVFAFEQLAPLKYGRTTVRYRLVTCTPADPIIVHIQDYRATLGGWIRLAFKNVAGDAGLTAVELASAGSDFRAQARVLNASSPWLSMANSFGAVWEASQLPEPPLDIRITNSVGEKVVIKNAIAVPGIVGDIETTPQFPVTNYKITEGINPNATLGINGTKGNRTARIRTPRTNRTALAVHPLPFPEAAVLRQQAMTAVSESAGRFVGVGLALPQAPQKQFAVRRYSQQLEPHKATPAVTTKAVPSSRTLTTGLGARRLLSV